MRIVISLLVEFKRSNAYFEAEALLYENFVAIHLFEVFTHLENFYADTFISGIS